ncbi:hypothetical protein B0A49_05193 [Cryomyces minteri]|uniref:Epoxide hydrolase N-terminal domain-containing protein n=1 Tax=Cryomyces minteri TaxID=331657 RepID=A0A4U0X460_9PEZI|nr:hypothetical protein B0A49_05193 [Cryomyces minteri]
MPGYDRIPSKANLQPKPFEASTSEEKLSEFKQLLKLSKIGPDVFENQQEDRKYGVTRKWLSAAKSHWEGGFDWRATERHINSFPNFTVPIKDDNGTEFVIHFAALFSEKEDAIPLAFFHGWPGSFLEFLDILSLLKKKYSPAELPYHVVVPSLPGYAYSSGPPPDKDMTTENAALVMNKLMVGLGFESGYIAQGGDIGSFVSRTLAVHHEACKGIALFTALSHYMAVELISDPGMHLNMCMVAPPENASELKTEEMELEALQRAQAFRDSGFAYAMEHGTRTATIGLALSSSPLALLAWIGEKFLEWTDTDPALDKILDSVTLYWLTETFPRCIYPYRQLTRRGPTEYCQKPFGYSWFPKELAPLPVSWAATTGNLVYYKRHLEGGHFAAMERPEELLSDVEEFVRLAWKNKEEGKL